MASAILNAVLLNFAGALYALIPGVYISATPHGFESVGSVDRCLEALQKNQLPLLDSCNLAAAVMTRSSCFSAFQEITNGMVSTHGVVSLVLGADSFAA